MQEGFLAAGWKVGTVRNLKDNEEETGFVSVRKLSKSLTVEPGLEPRSNNPGLENSETSLNGPPIGKNIP